MDWLGAKTALSDTIGLSRDALHLLVGVGLHFILVHLLRSWCGAFLPWLLILAAALGNEWIDLTFEVWDPSIRAEQWHDSAKDVVLTVLLPGLLLLLCRYWPNRLNRPVKPSE